MKVDWITTSSIIKKTGILGLIPFMSKGKCPFDASNNK
jgi:hypothetical protein